MITPEFVKYVKQKIAIGFSEEDLIKTIVRNGWTHEDLNEALDAIDKHLSVAPQPLANKTIEPAPNRTGKKLTVSIGLIIASIVYAFYQNTIPASSITFENKSTTSSPQVVATTQTPTRSYTQPTPTPTPKPATKTTPTQKPTPKPTPPPAPTPKKPVGEYVDGTYTGNSADAYYGTIQVEAIINNGVLADVRFLQYPSDRSTSVRINSRAMPILRQEAISAQSANVNIVSGATDSSQAFRQSMASALDKAKNL